MTVPPLYKKLTINIPSSLSAIYTMVEFKLTSYDYIFDTAGNALVVSLNSIMTGTNDCNPIGYFVSTDGFDIDTNILNTANILWENPSSSTTVSVY